MTNLVRAEILNLQGDRLRLVPSRSRDFSAENEAQERTFYLRVTNASDQFASFQVELLAEGASPQSEAKWYSVEPEICAKKPPGDRTDFQIVITKAPLPVYATTVHLTVNVFSVESDRLFATQPLLLSIEKPTRSLRAYLPFEDLKVYPGDPLEIPVLVYNLSPQTKQVALTLEGITPRTIAPEASATDVKLQWFQANLDETTKTVFIGAGESENVVFRCYPPPTAHTFSQLYDFTIAVQDQDRNSDSADGRIEVLPYGEVRFECPDREQTVSHRSSRLARRADYTLIFNNESNVAHQVELTVATSNRSPVIWHYQAANAPQAEAAFILAPASETTGQLVVQAGRRWLGLAKHLFLEVTPVLSNPHSGKASDPVQVKPATQQLELWVYPIVPIWLQLAVGLSAGLLTILGLSLLRYRSPHLAPVNSVRLISNAATVVSGSSDQTIQRWQVHDRPWTLAETRLEPQLQIADTGKPIRVIREIPADNNQIAAGLDNGTIQLWQVSPARKLKEFVETDRVFDLVFTRNSKFLFSGHGSSTVLQWDLESEQPINRRVLLNTAISSLAVSEPINQSALVAIAGQFNRLVLWDFQKNVAYEVNYRWESRFGEAPAFAPVFSQYDYINSLAIANDAALLATADNRGYLSLWNLTALHRCAQAAPIDRRRNTQPMLCHEALLNQWQGSQDHQPIRSIAMTSNGCYLASVGTDGRVMAWLLNTSGKPPKPMPIHNYAFAKLRSVDLQQPDPTYLLVASDAPQNQVRLFYKQVNPHDCRENSANPH